jgi:hypothetical protein
MSALPGRPDLDQPRRRARELLRAAAANDEEALRRIRAVSEKQTLSAAQRASTRSSRIASSPGGSGCCGKNSSGHCHLVP